MSGSLPRLGRDPRVLGWAFGHGVSEAGDQILSVALVFTAAQLAGPAAAGAVVAGAFLPKAALSLLGGAVVDRTDARRVMLGSDLAQLLVLLAALAVLAVGGESVGLLVALAVGYGIASASASAFYDPASFALPRQLRPAEDLTRVAGDPAADPAGRHHRRPAAGWVAGRRVRPGRVADRRRGHVRGDRAGAVAAGPAALAAYPGHRRLGAG